MRGTVILVAAYISVHHSHLSARKEFHGAQSMQLELLQDSHWLVRQSKQDNIDATSIRKERACGGGGACMFGSEQTQTCRASTVLPLMKSGA